jgi:hypothetical protein
MAVPKNKTELIFEIETNYTKLIKDLESIPAELTQAKELEGHAKGTKMSISDLVAYLVGWGELVLKWRQKKDDHELVDFPETGYKWNELGKLAQKFYSDYAHLDYQTLLIRLEKTKVDILEIVQNTSNQDLYEKPWYDKWPQGKMIQLNTSSPYKNARARVRKWKREYHGN